MKRALLIYPSPIAEIPHSLALLAAILKQEGYEVKGVINTFKKPLTNEDFLKEALAFEPHIIGVNVQTIQVLNAYSLIKELKRKGFFVIAGGAHVTDCPKEAVKFGVDIAFSNEAEESLREYLQGLPIRDILGITYMERDGSIISNPPRPRLRDLSQLPRPDFSVFDTKLFELEGDGLIKGINRVYSSRGCPGKCAYCDWQVFGQKVSYHPIPDLIQDIQERVDKYGITNFMIADDCFTTNRKHVEEFCRQIQTVTPRVVWQTSARADQTCKHPEMMQMMKDAGCYMVSMGIESGDPETLKRISKGVKLEDNYNAPHIAHDAGLQVIVNLMFGFPFETVESLQNTLNLVYDIWDSTHMFQVSGAVCPFPGTDIYHQYADEYGFKNYWLNEKYQGASVQIYQNALNPYAVSTYYQRNIYDDTYVQEEYFFPYTEEYKERLAEVIFETGRHNLETFYPDNLLKQAAILNLCKLSRMIYKRYPKLEKRVIGSIYEAFNSHARPVAEDYRNVKKGIVRD